MFKTFLYFPNKDESETETLNFNFAFLADFGDIICMDQAWNVNQDRDFFKSWVNIYEGKLIYDWIFHQRHIQIGENYLTVECKRKEDVSRACVIGCM